VPRYGQYAEAIDTSVRKRYNVAGQVLPTAHCPLATAHCQLPTVPLPTAHCQLAMAFLLAQCDVLLSPSLPGVLRGQEWDLTGRKQQGARCIDSLRAPLLSPPYMKDPSTTIRTTWTGPLVSL